MIVLLINIIKSGITIIAVITVAEIGRCLRRMNLYHRFNKTEDSYKGYRKNRARLIQKI
jgi:hypothetical protein